MSFAFLPLYTGDYLRDTMHLSCCEHGIYLRLLMYCWDQKGPAPTDERRLCGIVNARSGDEIEALRRVLEGFFVLMADGWYNKRMQREIEKSDDIHDKRERAGLQGGEAAARNRATWRRQKRRQRTGVVADMSGVSGVDMSGVRGGHVRVSGVDMSGVSGVDMGVDMGVDIFSDFADKQKESDTSRPVANATTPTPTTTLTPVVGCARRGSRLQQGFIPPAEWIAFCRAERPDLNAPEVYNAFHDYWIAKSGQGATKLDWFATWRNWVRNQKAFAK